jgi:hypothetical protein
MKLPPFYTRRIKHHLFEKLMRTGIQYSFYNSKSLEEFKYNLVKDTLDTYIDIKYEINTDTLPKEDNEMFILYMIQQYDHLLTMYYRKFKKDVTDNPRNL